MLGRRSGRPARLKPTEQEKESGSGKHQPRSSSRERTGSSEMNDIEDCQASYRHTPSKSFLPPCQNHSHGDSEWEKEKSEGFSRSLGIDAFPHDETEQQSDAADTPDSCRPADQPSRYRRLLDLASHSPAPPQDTTHALELIRVCKNAIFLALSPLDRIRLYIRTLSRFCPSAGKDFLMRAETR